MRISSRVIYLAVAGSLCLASTASAQRPTSIQCRLNNFHWSTPCSSDEECSRLYCDHLRDAHGIRCDGSGTGAQPVSTGISNFGAYVMAPIAGAVVGGAVMGGSDSRTDEQKEADTREGKMPPAVQGALIGAGAGLVAGFMMDMTLGQRRSPLPGIPWLQRARVTDASVRPVRIRFGLKW